MRAPLVEHASGDQNRKSALVSGAVVETVCTLCHIRLSAYHRSSPNVGWSRFRAVLMLTAIVPASAIGWNGTKVGSVIHRDLISKISGQNKTRVAPDIPPLLNRGAWLCSIFPYTHGLLPYNRLLLWPNKPRAHSVRKWCAPSNVERTSDSIAVWGA